MRFRINMKKTGENIRALMEEQNLSVVELRDLLGLASHQAVYFWLHGKSLPSIDNLLILARIFGKTVDEIVAVDEDPNLK